MKCPINENLFTAAPKFEGDSRPVSVNMTEGQDHTFKCGATGEPQPEIQWFVNGEANCKSSSNYAMSKGLINLNSLRPRDIFMQGSFQNVVADSLSTDWDKKVTF